MYQQLHLELDPFAISGAPLLRWPGGKRALLKHILPLVPRSCSRYYEPFFGGGALFFALRPERALLSDKNEELINCYRQVRDHPNEVIEYLSKLRNTEKDYYIVRNEVPTEAIARSARLIYLTALSFNGIHRMNSAGRFNVPYNHNLRIQPCDPVRIHAASVLLSGAELRNEDFEAAVETAGKGDLVYLDPPYTVAHGHNGFLQYNAKVFSWGDQTRLAELSKDLVRRGCKVIVSNADHSSILSLYNDFKLLRVERKSLIAASGNARRTITECIFYNEDNAHVAQH